MYCFFYSYWYIAHAVLNIFTSTSPFTHYCIIMNAVQRYMLCDIIVINIWCFM